ncbi:hypothetical protein [Aquicoccus porphyridii]|nr:hypothetical protein [Aquicoccus porphyridii]
MHEMVTIPREEYDRLRLRAAAEDLVIYRAMTVPRQRWPQKRA